MLRNAAYKAWRKAKVVLNEVLSLNAQESGALQID